MSHKSSNLRDWLDRVEAGELKIDITDFDRCRDMSLHSQLSQRISAIHLAHEQQLDVVHTSFYVVISRFLRRDICRVYTFWTPRLRTIDLLQDYRIHTQHLVSSGVLKKELHQVIIDSHK